MQTRFDSAALGDPDTAEAEKVLRKCVHCGFCTATCPTYVLLGDELDSPRGRIYLIKDMLEQQSPGHRAGRAPPGSLSVLPGLHDHLSVRRSLPAPHRSRPRARRAHLPQAAGANGWLRAALAKILPFPARLRVALGLARR